MPRLSLFALLGGITLLVGGCTSDTAPRIAFRAPVNDLPAGSRRRYAAGLAPNDTVELVLPGVRYDPPRITRTVRDSVDWTTIEGAVDGDYAAFKSGEPDRILAVFADTDTADIRSFLGDSAVASGSRNMFGKVDSVVVYAIAEHRAEGREVRLVFFTYREGPRRGNVHAYVNEHGGWRRTNVLVRRDTTVAKALSLFRNGAVTMVP